MKTTRRRLLGLLGLGAAAAVLPAEASEGQSFGEHVTTMPQETITMGGVTVDLSVPGGTLRIDREPYETLANRANEAVLSYAQAYEQGKADGYNRGREVEVARQEARQDDTEFLRGMLTQAARTGTAVTLESREYVISSPIDLSGSNRIRVVGNAVLRHADGFDGPMITYRLAE